MKIINTDEFNEIIKEGYTLVDFFADWCGPCKMLSPVLEEVSAEYDNVNFVKVNVDENMDLAGQFQIMSIPTVYIFKDGNVVSKMNGFRDAEGVKEFINEALNA